MSFPSLNALRVFASAAYAGSFKDVAQELGVSQSAITRQIQTLESQLGTRLFQRDNRLHALTPAGQRLAPELQQLFKQLERLVTQTQSIGDADVTTLRIALPDTWFRFFLAPLLPQFNSLYPHIRVAVEIIPARLSGEGASIISDLQHDHVDLVLAYAKKAPKQTQAISFPQQSWVALSPIANVSKADSLQMPWYIDTQHPWVSLWLQGCAEADDIRQHAIHTSQQASMLDRARYSDGIVLLEEQLAKQLHQDGWHVVSDVTNFAIPEPLRLIQNKRRQASVPVVAFSKWLQKKLESTTTA